MIEKLGNVFYRVRDMDAAVAFYSQVLGLPLKFRDGNNWAAFDVAGMTLALEGGEANGATASLRVSGLDELIGQLRERGATVSDPQVGAHERRATLTDPAGNTLVLYEPRA
jgi:catechol 2,3-dioxygenase-like lactoylglutathione lyase family enzyme